MTCRNCGHEFEDPDAKGEWALCPRCSWITQVATKPTPREAERAKRESQELLRETMESVVEQYRRES